MNFFKDFYGKEKEFFLERVCGDTSLEIAHQPIMWRELAKHLLNIKDDIAGFMKSIKNRRIIMTGAGSSGFTARAVARFLAKRGLHCESYLTTDIVTAPSMCFPTDTPTMLVSFARSGNSPESEGAVRYARKYIKDLCELTITCDSESKLSKATRESDKSLVVVMPEGTNDKGFAMTSSVSTMILAGFAIFSYENLANICDEILTLAKTVEENGKTMVDIAETCAKYNAERAWYLGSGPFNALVEEGALKMMELTNGAVAAGFNNSPEFRHGPKTVLNNKTITIHLISDDEYTSKYDIDLLNELIKQKDKNIIIAIADKKLNADYSVVYNTQGFNILKSVAAGLQGLVFMQLLSMFFSLSLKITTDNPSPSGLVNRVVQGVTVYMED